MLPYFLNKVQLRAIYQFLPGQYQITGYDRNSIDFPFLLVSWKPQLRQPLLPTYLVEPELPN
jgi:hypothetical protein